MLQLNNSKNFSVINLNYYKDRIVRDRTAQLTQHMLNGPCKNFFIPTNLRIEPFVSVVLDCFPDVGNSV